MLEGILPLNAFNLLTKLNQEKILLIGEVAKEYSRFQYGRIDADSGKVPFSLFTQQTLSSKRTFSFTSTHTWTLIRTFPLIFGNKLEKNKHYIHFLKAIRIFNLLMSDRYSNTQIEKIEKLIEEYLIENKTLYDKIIPKMHFLVHYGYAIRTYGPIKQLWAMRFEAKHSFFKRAQRSINNTINSSKSLADRHQYLFVYHLMSPHFLKNDEYECGPFKVINNDLNEIIKSLINDFSEIDNVKWVEFSYIKYTPDDIIIEPKNNNFAQIKNLIITKNKQIHLIYRELDIIRYSTAHNSFILKENDNLPYKSCLLSDLIFVWPMDLYRVAINGKSEHACVVKYPHFELFDRL